EHIIATPRQVCQLRIFASHGPRRQWTFGPACGTMAQTAGGGRRRGRSAMAFTPIDEQTW
ncbi:type II toxin-antitoxin system Phd/YefM family antitoxin, partial [Dysosmobacter welbionis]